MMYSSANLYKNKFKTQSPPGYILPAIIQDYTSSGRYSKYGDPQNESISQPFSTEKTSQRYRTSRKPSLPSSPNPTRMVFHDRRATHSTPSISTVAPQNDQYPVHSSLPTEYYIFTTPAHSAYALPPLPSPVVGPSTRKYMRQYHADYQYDKYDAQTGGTGPHQREYCNGAGGDGNRNGYNNGNLTKKRVQELEYRKSNKKRRKSSQNIPLRTVWIENDARRALEVEKEFNKRHKTQSLMIKFPDLELNREIVSKFHPQILGVHFQQPPTPRFCFITLSENANAEEIIKDLNKVKFGNGYLTAKHKIDREDDVNIGPKDIDPLCLYVGNLAPEVTVEDLVKAYPRNKRIDIRFAKDIKDTIHAFVCFHSVDDAIEAFQNTHATEMYSETLIVRFRRNGAVGQPGKHKSQNPGKRTEEINSTSETNASSDAVTENDSMKTPDKHIFKQELTDNDNDTTSIIKVESSDDEHDQPLSAFVQKDLLSRCRDTNMSVNKGISNDYNARIKIDPMDEFNDCKSNGDASGSVISNSGSNDKPKFHLPMVIAKEELAVKPKKEWNENKATKDYDYDSSGDESFGNDIDDFLSTSFKSRKIPL